MPNLNLVQLMGNLTRDPEMKNTQNGTAVCDIGLAINRVWTPQGGEKQEETTFVDITFWGKQAQTIAQYCRKGKPLYVEGRLQMDQWEDKTTGQQRSRLKVTGERFQFLGGRDDQNTPHVAGNTPQQSGGQTTYANPSQVPVGAGGQGGDIPF